MRLPEVHIHIGRKRYLNTIDRAMIVVSIIHPLTAVPQAIKIYATHDAKSLSLATWLMFIMIGVVFLIYAVTHKIKPLILNQLIWFAVDVTITIGILLYG
jgi:uncharacterized protein with PQ loop repeat